MKFASVIVVFLLLPFLSGANQIPIGYYSRFAQVWRFYERNGRGVYVPEILIYNITGQPITFCMKIALPGRELQESDMPLLQQYLGTDHDTVISPVTIPAHGYGIYRTESLVNDKSTGFFDAVIINGWCAGIMPVRGNLQLTDPHFHYYSYEGIGGGGGCLIGTDNLFTGSGEPGHFSLHYKCDELKRNYPVSEWQFEPSVEKGIAAITFCKEGECHTVDSGKPKAKFSVNIEKRDSFTLDAQYVVTRSDSLPELYLTRHFCNGCSQGMTLPVFLK